MNNLNTLSTAQLIQLHADLKKMIRTEQTRILNKKETLETSITRKRFEQKNKVLSDIDSKALFAGNVGDINSIIWPFFFHSDMLQLNPNTNDVINITVTQEAPFSLVAMQKVVFRLNEEDEWEYLNPRAKGTGLEDGGIASGLKFTVVDSQSRRNWFQAPISLDHIGDGKDPYMLPSPVLVLPNSNLEIQLINQNQDETYMVGMLFLGYRVRVEDAQNILSLVTLE